MTEPTSTHQHSIMFPDSAVCPHSWAHSLFLSSKPGMADGILNSLLSDSSSVDTACSDHSLESFSVFKNPNN